MSEPHSDLSLHPSVNAFAIREWVEAFGIGLRRHAVLGPRLTALVPAARWPDFAEAMTDFWAAALLRQGWDIVELPGPVQPLAALGSAHGQALVEVLRESVATVFDDATAGSVIERAERIILGLRVGAAAERGSLGCSRR